MYEHSEVKGTPFNHRGVSCKVGVGIIQFKNISGVVILRAFFTSMIVAIIVWVPVISYLFLEEARDVSRFVEEDTLVFVTKLKTDLVSGELVKEEFNNNYDLLNMYQATNADRISLTTESDGREETFYTVFIGVDYSENSAIESTLLNTMIEREQKFFKKQVPVQTDLVVEVINNGQPPNFLFVVSTKFQYKGETYNISVERNMRNVFGRYFQFEFDAFDWMFWGVLITTVIATVILIHFAFKRFRDTLIHQSEFVAVAHGEAPNLGKGRGLYYEEACDAYIQLGKRLDESNEHSITALSDISHFVATHLAEIKQAVDLINYYDLQDEKSVRAQMRRIEDNLARIRDIQSTIVSLTKLERTNAPFKPQVYDLQDLLNLTVDLAKKRYPSFEFSNPKTGGSKKICVHREHFLIIVEALIQNAVKYSSVDERKIIIEAIAVGVPKDKVQFSITNWGIGVPKDEEIRIFERYYRGSNTFQSESGVGLGLHMVYKILSLYDGDIRVESNKEKEHIYKTTFFITLNEYTEKT